MVRRYFRTASGAATAMMATIQASDCTTYVAVSPPIMSARTADAVTETGWCSANPCSHVGIDATGMNSDEAKISGKTIGNAAACAVSGSPTANPTPAKTHDIEYANSRTIPSPARTANTFVGTRNPTANPTSITSTMTNTLRNRSAEVRPARTAERAMGSDRNRSSRPLFRSVAKPTAVAIAPKTVICTNTPGSRKSTYGTERSFPTTPPNTYRKSSTNNTG